MKLMTFVYIGIAIVFLATIIIMLLQKYSPTKGKRQTRRGIIALACWGLGIALIFFGTKHYMASAASIVIVGSNNCNYASSYRKDDRGHVTRGSGGDSYRVTGKQL